MMKALTFGAFLVHFGACLAHLYLCTDFYKGRKRAHWGRMDFRSGANERPHQGAPDHHSFGPIREL